MKARLHDEAALRRTTKMTTLSTYGLHTLNVLRSDRDTLANEHRAHLDNPVSYARAARPLCARARQRRRDVEALCQELQAKIHNLDDGT
ncbi:hypothetical protein DFH09DRAFT_1307617 [Mycena vulgaris]|nr:hypothetical protein DFH09DRAFT_1307617 [Mycena vulgaris]